MGDPNCSNYRNPEFNSSNCSMENISLDTVAEVVQIWKKLLCLWHTETSDKENSKNKNLAYMLLHRKLSEAGDDYVLDDVVQLLLQIRTTYEGGGTFGHAFQHEKFKQNLNFLQDADKSLADIDVDNTCPFCKLKFLNYELLFSHMVNAHMEPTPKSSKESIVSNDPPNHLTTVLYFNPRPIRTSFTDVRAMRAFSVPTNSPSLDTRRLGNQATLVSKSVENLHASPSGGGGAKAGLSFVTRLKRILKSNPVTRINRRCRTSPSSELSLGQLVNSQTYLTAKVNTNFLGETRQSIAHSMLSCSKASGSVKKPTTVNPRNSETDKIPTTRRSLRRQEMETKRLTLEHEALVQKLEQEKQRIEQQELKQQQQQELKKQQQIEMQLKELEQMKLELQQMKQQERQNQQELKRQQRQHKLESGELSRKLKSIYLNKFDDDFLMDFIKAFADQKCLWLPNSAQYRDPEMKRKAMDNLADVFYKHYREKVDQEAIKKLIQRLRRYYIQLSRRAPPKKRLHIWQNLNFLQQAQVKTQPTRQRRRRNAIDSRNYQLDSTAISARTRSKTRAMNQPLHEYKAFETPSSEGQSGSFLTASSSELPNGSNTTTNTTANLFQCHICNKVYKRQNNLNKHIEREHPTKKCEICSVEFSNSSSLKRHLILVHRSSKVCPLGKCNVANWKTKEHLTMHFNEGRQGNKK